MPNTNHPVANLSWEAFSSLSFLEKSQLFSPNGRFSHVIYSQQFHRETLESLCTLATKIRTIAKQKPGSNFLSTLLNHKRAMLYFVQPSSRTFMSFLSACQILGIKVGDSRDRTTSSEIKGESQVDTVRTLASYFDLFIMRHPDEGFAEKISWVLENSDRPIPVLNGGSGRDQHPTQALLDIYTLSRSFENLGGIDGKKIAFVGDIKRGRTARSLARLLLHYHDVELYFVSPNSLKMEDDVIADLQAANIKYHETDQFEEIIPIVDAIYMMRIQDEYEIGIDNSIVNYDKFHFEERHLAHLKQDAIIMHPLPRRAEIAMAVDRDPRAMYWRQVRNGMWARTALIANIFGVENQIRNYQP